MSDTPTPEQKANIEKGVACRLCGKAVWDGASLKRVSPKGPGQKFIGECMVECGVRYISEDAKMIHAIRGSDNE